MYLYSKFELKEYDKNKKYGTVDAPEKINKPKKKVKGEQLQINGNPISRFHLNSFASYLL